MQRQLVLALAVFFTVLPAVRAEAQPETRVTFDEALRAARGHAPDLAVARAHEGVARSEVAVAGVHPNPSVTVGTSTQAARLSVGVSVPLVILGQRGAAIEAARAEQAGVSLEKSIAWNDVRRSAAHAYNQLWLSEHTARARRELVAVAVRVEKSVTTRVETGSAPEMDRLRASTTRLRAEADAEVATEEVDAAADTLARWIGAGGETRLRTRGDPWVRDPAPSLAALLPRIGSSPMLRRERADLTAARARAARERAAARPGLVLGLGADAYDPGLPATNYRAELTIDVPLFNQRGAYVDREQAAADMARARARTARADLIAELSSAYRRYQAASTRKKSLLRSVVPAAEAAASATEEAYALGRASLVDVLDAERTLIDARLAALEAQAAQADAWVDVIHALGDA